MVKCFTLGIMGCIVPKKFRIKFYPETYAQGMKLSKRRIHWFISHKKKGFNNAVI